MYENRIAIISIIVEDRTASAQINKILSDFGDFVVGRMGIPYRQKEVSVMCVVVDAPTEVINQVTGKIGMLSGVSAKTVTSKK
ncbi:MAG: iron-only hydrogenase system regulator [Clostridia bacterium]|nr:iron-only hydrogenase system regulator [Clostridia bacterium]